MTSPRIDDRLPAYSTNVRDDSCLYCAFSSGNPAWLDFPGYEWRFKAKARPEWCLSCFRYSAGTITTAANTCAGFRHRAEPNVLIFENGIPRATPPL